MARTEGERTPGSKLLLAILIGAALAIPLFSVWLLVYDRQTQSEQARASITEGWGGPQTISGPMLVIPYRATANETVVENGQSVTRSRDVDARADAGARDGRRCDDRCAGAAQALDLRGGRLRREAHRHGALRISAGSRAARRQGRGHGLVAGRAALRRQRPAWARRQSRSRRQRRPVCGSSPVAEVVAGAASSPGSMPANWRRSRSSCATPSTCAAIRR